MSDWILGIILGVMVGAIFVALVIIPIGTESSKDIQTQLVLKALEDCKIKEYYYIDTNRVLCDRIGVSP